MGGAGDPGLAPLPTIGDLKAMVLLAEVFSGHMRAIGILTVRWSEVDRLLYSLLKDRFARLDAAEKLRGSNAGTNRLEFFKARLKEAELTAEEKSSLAHAVDQITALYVERNSIVHGQYGIVLDDNGNMTPAWSDIGLRKRKHEQPPPDYLEPAMVTEDHLMQHANAVYEASRPLFGFLHHRS